MRGTFSDFERVTSSAPRTPWLLVVSGDRLIRDALTAVLGGAQSHAISERTRTTTLAFAATHPGVVVLLDLEGPQTPAAPLGLIADLSRLEARAVVFARRDAQLVRRECARAGAAAFVSRADTLDNIIRTIDLVRNGEFVAANADAVPSTAPHVLSASRPSLDSLTRQEARVLDGLMRGLVAKQVANELVVSLPTVRSHIRSILTKLDARSQVHAIAIAFEAGGAFTALTNSRLARSTRS
jgi:DNA-binding NarL/FixJ family response regulator